jgi:hypothetical protein
MVASTDRIINPDLQRMYAKRANSITPTSSAPVTSLNAALKSNQRSLIEGYK